MASRLPAALVVLVAVAVPACRGPRAPDVVIDWEDFSTYRARPLQFGGVPGAAFASVPSATTGVTASTHISEDARLANRTLAQGTGVALGDADGDGWVDVYVCVLDGPNVLYKNLGGWRFADMTASSGAGLPDRMSRGAVFADADGDGDLDLFVAVHGGPNVLLANDGTGVFEERDAGFTGSYGSGTIALADVDADGDLDAYFANYKTIQADDLFSPAERATQRIVVDVDGGVDVRPQYRDYYRVERVGDSVRRWELADPDEFYLNDGTGRFRLVTMADGWFRKQDGSPLEEQPRAWGLVARFFDLDDDDDPDLYVANDFGSPDGIWINEGGGFRAASGLAIRSTSASSMGVDYADIDRDGDTDFITTEMLALDPVRRRTQSASVTVAPTPPGQSATRALALRNTLQLNRGDGTFAEVARGAGIDASEWTWGALFLDADLDGFEDLLVTTGHAWNPLDGDTQEALRTGRISVDWRRELSAFPPLPLRNLAFHNLGDGTFEERGEAWGYGADADISHGIATADLDRDGDLDVVITRLDRAPLILRNDAGGGRVLVRLVGSGANTQGIGARVTLEGGAVPTQTRQISSGGMYLSGSDPALTFGMGENRSGRLHVRWPSGAVTSIDVEADRAYEVTEPAAGVGARNVPESDPGSEDAGPRLFERLRSGAMHRETSFDELGRQPLIPIELSRLGPGVSWVDVDGDGDVDLVTAAARGGRATIVRTEGGRLLGPTPMGPRAQGDQTTILEVAGSTGTALLAGISSWEGSSPDALREISGLVDLGATTAGDLVPPDYSMVGPLAAADVDGDGDLDLFLGGRVLPGAYPLPASSKLLRNTGSGWTEDRAQAETFHSVGLVSGAVFSDVDLDGDPDLVLALEWGPIRLFVNDGGTLRDATEAWGLGGTSGRWNGIATGDLNGDGRPDLVATSWGTNTGRRPTVERPASVIAADFDGNGQMDVLEAYTDASGRSIPERDYRTLSSALPFIRRSVPSFAAFSKATVEDLIGARPGPAYRANAVTLEHTIFLNLDDSFEPTPLPPAAQRAPGFGVIVADLDRDGSEDVFIAQNFLATPEGIARDDAGRGAVLLGDGTGSLRAVDGAELGLAVYGDGRGAAIADYDEDGRWDLAVGQNGEETALFHGVGGKPGLRVRVLGEATNPDAIGAALRLLYEDGAGPVREIQAGSGYWSQNGTLQVFGMASVPRAVWIRWPGGRTSEYPVEPGAREITIRAGEVDADAR